MLSRFCFLMALVMVLSASQAHAQPAVRTWVSATSGLDTNECTRSSPCRNFGPAVTAVAVKGEVVVLDSGGYGPVSIAKSVSIISPAGIHAAVAPTNGSAIVVEIIGGTVILRNIYLNSQGATVGVDLFEAAALHLEGVVVSGFSSSGIYLVPVTQDARVFVKDSIARGNGVGLVAWTNLVDTVCTVSVDGSRFEDNDTTGILVFTGGQVHLRDSVSAGNSLSGARINSNVSLRVAELTAHGCSFVANGTDGVDVGGGVGPSTATVSDSMIANNNLSGGIARISGELRIHGNTITGNGTGLSVSGGPIRSSGTNSVTGNTTEQSGTLTPAPPR